ncbi:MAG: hypothetical protein RJB11_1082, partial [Planctomycetota bacterium]
IEGCDSGLAVGLEALVFSDSNDR